MTTKLGDTAYHVKHSATDVTCQIYSSTQQEKRVGQLPCADEQLWPLKCFKFQMLNKRV